MKAIVHTEYGPPDELQLKEVEKPVPKEDQVLIKIRATTVRSSDCNVRNLTFCPTLFLLPMRVQFGLRKPKVNRLGTDLAGEIEATGKDVERFKQGDQVFGRCDLGLGALLTPPVRCCILTTDTQDALLAPSLHTPVDGPDNRNPVTTPWRCLV
jgi:NADPH:quinone reductase-like Zn-dependent oxidoreductase